MKACTRKGALGRLAAGALLWAWAWAVSGPMPAQAEQAAYVGSQACQECHEGHFKRFEQYAKKAHSFQSITLMSRGLTEAEVKKCYECHTTGYNRPGGFRSEAETPQLKNAGCEVCHGPGSLHVASQDPKDIKAKLSAKDCESCHNSERVGAFRYRPVLFGGAH